MTEQFRQVTVTIGAGPEADLKDLEKVTREVKRLLDDGGSGVERAEVAKGGAAPGAKSGGAELWGTLLVDVAPPVLAKLIDLLWSWARRKGTTKIVLKIGKDELSTEVPKDQAPRLVEEWLRRHGGK